MKIIRQNTFQLELEFDELSAIAKIIGVTNGDERQKKFGMSKEQSDKLSVMYSKLYDLLGEENC